MTSPVRPFLSSVLCCAIALGHAPAWMHVATCDGHSHSMVTKNVANPSSGCSHCCHQHHGDGRADDTVAGFAVTENAPVGHSPTRGGGPVGSHDEHDSDDCLICQSLASPCGVTWKLESLLLLSVVVQPALLPIERSFASPTLSIAHPRGPPVAV